MESVKALFDNGILSQDQKMMVQGFCKRWDCSGFEALIETNIIQEAQFADHAAEMLKLPRLRHLRRRELNRSFCQLLPLAFARRHMALVVDVHKPAPGETGKSETSGTEAGNARIFKVAVANPWDVSLRHSLEDMLGGSVEISVAERGDILDAIDRNYPFSDFVPEFWRSISSVTAD